MKSLMKPDEEAHIQSRGYEKGKSYELETLIKKVCHSEIKDCEISY